MKTRLFSILAFIICLLLVGLGLYQRREAQRFSGYEEIVSQVQEGKLRANSSGDITLPQSWAWLTQNGHVYQTKDKRSGLALLFPAAVDKYSVDWGDGKIKMAQDIAGYVYCSGSLPGDAWFTFDGMNDVKIWDKRNIIRPHWCYVEPFYSY